MLFILLMSWLNAVRGGAAPARQIIEWMRDHFGFGIRALILVVPFVFLFTLMTGLYLTGVMPWAIAGLASLSFLLWGVFGWGSYMDMGQTEDSWKDKVEIRWIDGILLRLFGPEWVPEGSTSDRFDVVPSPTGGVRPYEWRRKRDAVGMALRGLYAAPFFIGMALMGNWIFLLLLPLFCLAFSLSYCVFFSHWWMKVRQPTIPLLGQLTSTTAAELSVGALWGLVILMAL